jgi:hypothetical protein
MPGSRVAPAQSEPEAQAPGLPTPDRHRRPVVCPHVEQTINPPARRVRPGRTFCVRTRRKQPDAERRHNLSGGVSPRQVAQQQPQAPDGAKGTVRSATRTITPEWSAKRTLPTTPYPRLRPSPRAKH